VRSVAGAEHRGERCGLERPRLARLAEEVAELFLAVLRRRLVGERAADLDVLSATRA
jgi:hypothetical protein